MSIFILKKVNLMSIDYIINKINIQSNNHNSPSNYEIKLDMN